MVGGRQRKKPSRYADYDDGEEFDDGAGGADDDYGGSLQTKCVPALHPAPGF